MLKFNTAKRYHSALAAKVAASNAQLQGAGFASREQPPVRVGPLVTLPAVDNGQCVWPQRTALCAAGLVLVGAPLGGLRSLRVLPAVAAAEHCYTP